MTDLRALVQDLRAEAHRVPPDVAKLMRRAAVALETGFEISSSVSVRLLDFEPTGAPVPPPDVLETYEQGADSLS